MTLLVLIIKNTNKYCEIKKNIMKIVVNSGDIGGKFNTKVIPYSDSENMLVNLSMN